MQTTLLNIKIKETGKPYLLVVSEDVPGIGTWQTEITIRGDHSKLRGPIEEEKWRMIAAVWEQLDLVLRAHHNQHE